ncbi:MAG TPA: hypothetical protein VHN77_13255, partial [Phycisphaerales bacterium]|nr:hypothetical protein [Phycisphaerales bacterium]
MSDFPTNGQHYPPQPPHPSLPHVPPHQQYALPGSFQPQDFGAPQQPQANIFKVIHGIFRGRYMLTGILASVFLLAGAAYAILTNKPLFK